jgi:hypothetical protein
MELLLASMLENMHDIGVVEYWIQESATSSNCAGGAFINRSSSNSGLLMREIKTSYQNRSLYFATIKCALRSDFRIWCSKSSTLNTHWLLLYVSSKAQSYYVCSTIPPSLGQCASPGNMLLFCGCGEYE